MSICRGFGVLVLTVFSISTAQAIYIRPDLENVPVERVLKNLTQQVEKNPKDVQAQFNLARAHAMAFTLKADTLPIWKGKEGQGVWFGYEARHVPFGKIKETDDPAKAKAAKDHLAKAIAGYQEVVKLAPENLTARLGLAWCQDQAKEKMQALAGYRSVIEDAWKKEKDMKRAGLGWHSVTSEAAGYLMPHLDAEKDKMEIATLQERIAQMRKVLRPITPIAIPLQDGLNLRDLMDANASVPFDADGSGWKKSWTWINDKAGWLVMDHKGNGQITSALQMFGNVTFWMFWENGYHALSALDENADGLLKGKELEGLAIWHDANGNGISEPGEVQSLSFHGIVGLSCRFVIDGSQPEPVPFSPHGVIFGNGRTRASYDVILKAK
jgi:hypothetical protein